MVSTELNDLIMRVARRAENAPPEVLRAAFVPVPSLLAQLDSDEHQILFGRRGTGKTHLLRHLQEQRMADGALSIYLDLRQIGAAGDVFSAGQDSFSELATGLLVDVIESIHTQIYEQVLDDRWSSMLGEISQALDALAEAATQIRVIGETEVEQQKETSSRATGTASVEISLTPDPRAAWRAESSKERSKRSTQRRLDRGHEAHYVLLGPLSGAFRALAAAVHPHPVWLLLDEWSALPLDLQPLLADLLRRTVFATNGVVVKISAIHGRSRFADVEAVGNPVGLELGADTAATLDLDDFLLFRNDVASTLDFYSALLCRHMAAMPTRVGRTDGPAQRFLADGDSHAKVINRLFATAGAFHALVLGAEGVPRDALQIAGLAAGTAFDEPITANHVAEATRNFFLRDKDARIPKAARHAYTNLIEQAARQKSRIIPLRRDGESDDEVIQRLYDARVIHRVRQGLRLDAQHPTEVYDVYVIDSGAFLGLITTGKIRPAQDGLDPGARFADAAEIEIRGPTFVRMPHRWYSRPPPGRR
jgi:hypothetical protein